jgi:RNA polymerase sigma-70 factor (ECF subfamily)
MQAIASHIVSAKPMTDETPHDWLNEHGDYLYRFALARLRDPHLAEDAVQEALLAAIQSRSYEGRSAARTWLTGILKHKIVDIVRKQSREQPIEDFSQHPADGGASDDYFNESGHWSDKPELWVSPDSELEQKQFLAVLQTCMDRLPKRLASLFLMRDIFEDENEVICKELGISPTNAWVMLYRARMGLRKCLELHWPGNGSSSIIG